MCVILFEYRVLDSSMCVCVYVSEAAGVCVCVVLQRRCWRYVGGLLSEEASWRTITRRVNICFPSFPSGS